MPSSPPGPLLVRNENLSPTHKASQATLRYHKAYTDISWPRQDSKPRPENLYIARNTASAPITPESVNEVDSLVDIDLNAGCGEDSIRSDEDAAGCASDVVQPRLSFDPAIEDTLEASKLQARPGEECGRVSPSAETSTPPRLPFRRWMRSLRYKSPSTKSLSGKNSLKVRDDRWSLDDFEESPVIKSAPISAKQRTRHKKTSSWSSGGLVTAVKSATVGLAAPQSPKAKRLSLLRSSLRSSGTSQATVRGSFDSQSSPRVMDSAAWERARQRRRTLEEIVQSEESYVADLKVLVNVGVLGISC
ncbi:MAG: hypothetical protein Q9195_007549 [Heterodermia aff. obscurata]